MRSVFDDVLGAAPTARKSTPGGSVFDDLLPPVAAAPTAAPTPPPAEAPGMLEAALRGGGQGISQGFSDEITGAAESALTSKTYAQARDEARAANEAARKAHPIAYGASELIGGLAGMFLPTGVAGKAAGLGVNIARGAAAGITSGLGHSEADITKGDVEGAAHDAAIGGLMGGAVGGIAGKFTSKALGGAVQRGEQRTMSEALEGAKPAIRTKLALRNEGTNDVTSTLEEFGLVGKVAKDPEKFKAVAKTATKDVGEQLGEIYKPVTVDRADAANAMFDVVKKVKADPATSDLAPMIEKKIENLREAWSKYPTLPDGTTPVPASEVARFARSFSQKGFAGSGMDPTVARELQKDVWGGLKRTIRDSVEKTSGAGAANDLDKLNLQYSILSDVGKASRQRGIASQFVEKTPDRHVNLYDRAIGVAKSAVAPVVRPMDMALARLMKAARAGDPKAIQTTRAIANGAPWSLSSNIGDVPTVVIETAAAALSPSDDGP